MAGMLVWCHACVKLQVSGSLLLAPRCLRKAATEHLLKVSSKQVSCEIAAGLNKHYCILNFMVPVFSPKANFRKICCIKLLKDWRIWMEESRSSQLPKGDLSFQLFPKDASQTSEKALRHYMFTGRVKFWVSLVPTLRESSKSRMIWESAENHP